jgi:hypothetical protein
MKKHIISLVLVSVICIAPLYSLGGRRTEATSETTNTTNARMGTKVPKLNRVEFWSTVIVALKKNGHAADSPEVQHAQRYLQRAQARQQKMSGTTTAQYSTRARKNSSYRARKTDRQEPTISKTAASTSRMRAGRKPTTTKAV